METAARCISATERVTLSSLRNDIRIELIGKGGKAITLPLSPDLHRILSVYLVHYPGPLAGRRGYQSAYARAILMAGGKVTATHGVRRLAVRQLYRSRYRQAAQSGMSSKSAARKAAGDAIEALGHCRDRRDHKAWYLGN